MEKFYMFHLAAYSASYTGATEQDLTPVTDGILTVQNGHFVSQTDRYAIWLMGIGANLVRTRIITPTLRQVTTPFIRPIEENAAPGNLAHFMDLRHAPLLMRGLEEIQMDTVQDSGGAERENVLLALADSPPVPATGGQVWCMRGTSTTTATANAWTQVTTTWQDTLPAGTYSCIGLEAIGASTLAARMTFENQYLRPGCPGVADDDSWVSNVFTNGSLGEWGRFTSVRLPTIEVLATAGTATFTFYLYFRRTS